MHPQLFRKETTRDEKATLWDAIADKVNQLDIKSFKRTGKQVKRKYIKYTSEMKLKGLKSGESPTLMETDNAGFQEIEVEDTEDEHQPTDQEETAAAAESITVTTDAGGALSFVDIMNMAGMSESTGVHHSNSLSSCQSHEDLERERLSLTKIDLYMKMRKYHKNGFLTATDVKLITRWIKNPLCAPFKNSHQILGFR